MSEYRPIKPAASPVSYCMHYPSPHQRCNQPIPATDLYCLTCKTAREGLKNNSSDPARVGREKGTAFLSNPRGAGTRVTPQPEMLYSLLGPEIAEALIAEAHKQKGMQKRLYFGVPVEYGIDELGVEGDVVVGSVAEGRGSEGVGK